MAFFTIPLQRYEFPHNSPHYYPFFLKKVFNTLFITFISFCFSNIYKNPLLVGQKFLKMPICNLH